MFFNHLKAAAVLAAAFAVSACGKDAATDPLAYVPENTPFLIANLEPVPNASIDMWLKNSEQMMPMYERMLDKAIEDMGRDRPADVGMKLVIGLRDEMKGKLNRAGLESFGLSMSARSAFYGVGLIPVMRIELGDPAAFRGFIARLESKAGEKLGVAKIGDQEYWTAGPADAKLQLVAAIQGEHLVITLAPRPADDAVLKTLLGIELPKKSVLDAKTLAKFNADRGYLAYGSGYLDSAKLIEVLFAKRTPVEQAFLDALEQKNPLDDVSEQCKAEYRAISAQVPRITFGYTELGGKQMSLRYVFETTPVVGAELVGLAVTVPGLDGHGEGLFDFGFGIDLNALVKFVNAKAGAVASAPYQCESLQSLNDAFAKARTNINNPAVFMVAAAYKGLYASLSKLDMPEGGSPEIEGKLVIASDNPQSLLSMVGNFAPPLAGLTVEPNQAPVALPMTGMPPGIPPTFIAMSDKSIGIAVGASEEKSLQAFIKDMPSKPSPLLHYGVDGAGMARFFDLMIKQAEADLVAKEAMLAMSESDEDAEEGEADDDQAEIAKKQAEAREAFEMMKSMRDMYTKFINRADVAVFATARGIEIEYNLQMK